MGVGSRDCVGTACGEFVEEFAGFCAIGRGATGNERCDVVQSGREAVGKSEWVGVEHVGQGRVEGRRRGECAMDGGGPDAGLEQEGEDGGGVRRHGGADFLRHGTIGTIGTIGTNVQAKTRVESVPDFRVGGAWYILFSPAP